LACQNEAEITNDCCVLTQLVIGCLNDETKFCDSAELQDMIDAAVSFLDGDRCGQGSISDSTTSCFPAGALVSMADGTQRKMSEVRSGDVVMVANGRATEIFGFTHRLETTVSEFVRIEAEDFAIELSKGHYLPVAGKLTAAKNVQAGDEILLANGSAAVVSSTGIVRRIGLYNPQTLEGHIVVNGVVASTYTEAVPPRVAHFLLAIPRLLYTTNISREPLGKFFYGDSSIARFIVRVRSLVEGTG